MQLLRWMCTGLHNQQPAGVTQWKAGGMGGTMHATSSGVYQPGYG
jgi:hypothetical protein